MPSSYPPWLLPSLAIFLATALTFRSRALSTAVILYGLYWLVHFHFHHPTGPFVDVFTSLQLVFNLVCRTITYLLLKDPAQHFVRVDKKKSDGQTSGAGGKVDETKAELSREERPLWKRWLDGLEIAVALRGVGWAYQVSGIPPAKPASYPRWKFVLENLVGAAWRFLAIDAGSTYIRSTPLGTLPVTRLLHEEPLYRGLLHAALIEVMARWAMDMTYRVISAVAVAVQWGGPDDWPPMFWLWADAWTVRRFWSKTWHQLMRTVAEPPVHWLLHDVLRVRKGTYVSNYGKVFGAFFMAYAVHGYGSNVAGGSHVGDWNFFMGQAVAIWVEETVLRLAVMFGIRQVLGDGLARVIGYLWTCMFILYSFMLWTDWAAAAGSWTEDPFGFSVARVLLDRFDGGNG